MRPGIRVLFVSAFTTPFIQDDLEVLEKHFTVRRQIGRGPGAVLRILAHVPASDVVFCWFGSVYAFFAIAAGAVFGLKSIVVVGGVDAARDVELDYGLWLSPWRAKLLRFVFRRAARILVVDQSLATAAVRLANYDGSNIVCLPTGYDSEFWRPVGEKEPVVLTVAVAADRRTFRRKGIDTLIEAARKLPQVTFIVIGTDEAIAFGERPPLNMKFYARMPRRQILPFYQQAKVYCQPSRWEGLPNALCEAMLAGCIPVASDVGGNPTAVGNAGILVPPGDGLKLAEAIGAALSMGGETAGKARARIVALFPKERRERELVRFIGESAE